MRIAWIYFPVYVNCRARHNYANPDGEWNPNVGEMHESLVQSEKSAQPNGKTPIVGARNARLRDAEVSVPYVSTQSPRKLAKRTATRTVRTSFRVYAFAASAVIFCISAIFFSISATSVNCVRQRTRLCSGYSVLKYVSPFK